MSIFSQNITVHCLSWINISSIKCLILIILYLLSLFKNTINILVNYTSNENQTSGEKIIFLHIFNVDNLETYTELSKYIAQFNRVKNVSLENLSQTSVIFKLTLINNASTGLIQYLNKNRELHFIKQESTPFQAKQQDVQNIIPTLYYDYGQTITTQYQT